MFGVVTDCGDLLSLEVFMSDRGVCLTVPRDCGLSQADTLRIDMRNRTVAAFKAGSELPVDLPALSEAHCLALIGAGDVAVGELVPQGVVTAYYLAVEQIHYDQPVVTGQ